LSGYSSFTGGTARHHSNLLWRVCHQIHHSPAHIEVVTAFYKHPLEIAADALLISVVLYLFLGASVEGVVWYNVFAAFGEYFYHSNIRASRWIGFFLQRPEHHSIHHQLDLTNSTMETSRCGIASSEPSGKLMISLPNVVSQMTTRKIWETCSSSRTLIDVLFDSTLA
jgi:Fatty acid hydroxylase superfamily